MEGWPDIGLALLISGDRAYIALCQGGGQPRVERREESPGSTKQGWRVTPAGGDPRESATESIPPMEAKPHRQG